jgi:hypothetical protein
MHSACRGGIINDGLRKQIFKLILILHNKMKILKAETNGKVKLVSVS